MSNLIEQIRDYWNRRPCNLRHGTAEIGTKEYFDQVEQRRYMVEPHGYAFADFPKWNGKRVLEIGCGLGTDAINFARNGADYVGIDLSDESVKLCQKRFEIYKLDGQILQADAEHLSNYLEPQSFDLIYSFGVIHHSADPSRVVAHFKNYMHKDSELRIMLYAKSSWKNIMIEAGLDQPEAQSGCPQAITYSHDDVKNLLKDFSSVDIEQTFIFPWQIEHYVRYEYVKQPWFQSMPAEMFAALEKRLGWHLLIKARL